MEEIIVIVLGLIFGSFLNVVIHRLPLEKSIVKPGSFCPECGNSVRAYDNIPVLSYMFLLGKCRDCKAHIPIRYPLVEIFTAFTFWYSYSLAEYGIIHLAFTIIFLLILIALCLIDLKHMILPDELTLGGSVLFLIYSFFNPEVRTIEAIITALGVTLAFAGIYLFYIKVRKIEGLGQGDIKMVFLLGIFLGIQKLIVTILLASLSGLAVGIIIIIIKKKDFKYAIPFGTFLSMGGYISYFFGEKILKVISSFYI
ncbi:MAG: prepilin peptidase [Acidobacteriota bacterium]